MEAGCGGGEVGRFRHIADIAKVPFCMCEPVASMEIIKQPNCVNSPLSFVQKA